MSVGTPSCMKMNNKFLSSDLIRQASDNLSKGHDALARGAWQEARASFAAALQEAETAAACDGLGMAAWWLNDATTTFDARQRAYRLYTAQGQVRSAARLAAYLALDYFYFQGAYAVANGWVQRGRRLLDGLEPGAERGWLDVAEAYIIMWADLNYAAAQQLCLQAASLAKALGDVDLEMAALAGEGLCLVSLGQVHEGMRRLDEATLAAIAGEMSDIDAACTACCSLIFACEWTRDYERAGQWIERLRQLATRWSHPSLLAFCRIHYATLLVWQGDWQTAEAELLVAVNDLEGGQLAKTAEALVRLAELRCRQGRFDEADALFSRVESPPFKALAGESTLYGRALLALAQDRLETAVNLAHRFLRALPADNRLERVAGLELLIEAEARQGNAAAAQSALTELKTAVSDVTTKPMQAAVHFAEAMAAAVAADHTTACRSFEDALELWSHAAIPFEIGRTRLALAQSLLALDRLESARQQTQKALALFEQLEARAHQTRAAGFLRRLDAPKTSAPSDPAELTPREREVLGLLATGLSNQEISHELVLSVRTVERHISNIYGKLDVSGPSARAAATTYAHRQALVQS
jgi:LuxR family transcriptional regulator, maltose regulon positive regulatory protein